MAGLVPATHVFCRAPSQDADPSPRKHLRLARDEHAHDGLPFFIWLETPRVPDP
jgi:hypothetical protein